MPETPLTHHQGCSETPLTHHLGCPETPLTHHLGCPETPLTTSSGVSETPQGGTETSLIWRQHRVSDTADVISVLSDTRQRCLKHHRLSYQLRLGENVLLFSIAKWVLWSQYTYTLKRDSKF